MIVGKWIHIKLFNKRCSCVFILQFGEKHRYGRTSTVENVILRVRVTNVNTEEEKEPNLEGASQMIEILSLLEQKTRGNLTPEEDHFFENLLTDLRLRYVEATRS